MISKSQAEAVLAKSRLDAWDWLTYGFFEPVPILWDEQRTELELFQRFSSSLDLDSKRSPLGAAIQNFDRVLADLVFVFDWKATIPTPGATGVDQWYRQWTDPLERSDAAEKFATHLVLIQCLAVELTRAVNLVRERSATAGVDIQTLPTAAVPSGEAHAVYQRFEYSDKQKRVWEPYPGLGKFDPGFQEVPTSPVQVGVWIEELITEAGYRGEVPTRRLFKKVPKRLLRPQRTGPELSPWVVWTGAFAFGFLVLDSLTNVIELTTYPTYLLGAVGGVVVGSVVARWRRVQSLVVAGLVVTLFGVAGVAVSLGIDDLLEGDKPEPVDVAVDYFVESIPKSMNWTNPPTIQQGSVDYFKTHFGRLNPFVPHPFIPARAFAGATISVDEAAQRLPEFEGESVTVEGRITNVPTQVTKFPHATAWAFLLGDTMSPDNLVACRAPLVPLRKGEDLDFVAGDTMIAEGVLLADGGIHVARPAGRARAIYMACASVARRPVPEDGEIYRQGQKSN